MSPFSHEGSGNLTPYSLGVPIHAIWSRSVVEAVNYKALFQGSLFASVVIDPITSNYYLKLISYWPNAIISGQSENIPYFNEQQQFSGWQTVQEIKYYYLNQNNKFGSSWLSRVSHGGNIDQDFKTYPVINAHIPSFTIDIPL